MRYLIILIVIASAGLIIYGFNLDDSQEALAHKCIGSGTLGLFLLAMPLFLLTESKGKKFKDYMLTDESVRKMQGKEPRKPKDS
ncbi:MAG: hypothetical protein Mars2KO_29150 [Maribacter sp.]|uniref:hypothetical protein n=1 Tax=Maribacter sp. 2307UL18-2 TaxID=3386274 RepID=UPI0039BC8576